MEKQIKKDVDEALAGSGLLTKDDMESMISKLEARVLDCMQAEIAKATKPLEARVQALEKKIEIYDAHFANLEQKLDDAEQYSRRSCLRIINIPLPEQETESASECVEKVKEIIGSLKVKVSPDCIDRAHRIGKIKTAADGKGQSRAMIVKFTSWESRTAVYRARKEQDKVKIFMDLTPRRSKLFSDAKSKANSDPNIDFAFADINCRLGFKLKDGSFKFFNSNKEMSQI